MGNRSMEKLEERLDSLVKEACRHRPGSRDRLTNLTKLIRLISPKLWKANTPYYEDALQQTWVYFCQNICEAHTGEAYDPDRSSAVTWLNVYLRRRLQDFYLETQKQQARTVSTAVLKAGWGFSRENTDLVEELAANPDIPPLLEAVAQWAKTDPGGELRRLHINSHPEITARALILRRLPPETSWKELAAEFGVPASTLSSFYQRQCLPRLRKFGESEGYI